MTKKSLLIIYALLLVLQSWAQPVIAPADTSAPPHSRLRISLLTCGTGDQVYETFGHTAIRIVDSNISGPLGDVVYNYGMFNGYDENFEMKFMRGKLLYYVATNLFPDFMSEYREYGRSVQEQILLIPSHKKDEINNYLRINALPENRNYKYDFFFDNCATRLRDIFPNALGKDFVYGNALPANEQYTFRDIINQYFYRKHWERIGVNILLGSKIDKVMSNTDIMFLPDYLRDGLDKATLNGKKIATPPQLLLDGSPHVAPGTNVPLLLTSLLLVLAVAGISTPKLRLVGRIANTLILFVTGLLGFIILTMWFATDHQGCSNNYNLLWALPLNIVVAFARPKGRSRYSLIAMVLIVVSFILHLLHVQGIIPELWPLLLALLVVHYSIFRQNATK